jgi:pyruvate dehydrogenase E1 component alpha subunit
MGTRLDQASATLEFEKRAETFGLLAAEVDGIDVFEVYNQSKNLLEDVRKGKPAFLKVNSYRFHGHARMDKSPYRDQQEEEEGRKKDAIAFLRDRIIKSGWYQETECDAIVEEVKQEMDEALNHARNAADPGADEMYEDVFDPKTTKPFPVDSRIRESLHLPQA